MKNLFTKTLLISGMTVGLGSCWDNKQNEMILEAQIETNNKILEFYMANEDSTAKYIIACYKEDARRLSECINEKEKDQAYSERIYNPSLDLSLKWIESYIEQRDYNKKIFLEMLNGTKEITNKNKK